MTNTVPTKRQYIKSLYQNEDFVELALNLMRARHNRPVWLPDMKQFAEALVAKPITDFINEDEKYVLMQLVNEVQNSGGDTERFLPALAKLDVDKPKREVMEGVDFAVARNWFVSLFPTEDAALNHLESGDYRVHAESVQAFFSSESGVGLYAVELSSQRAARASKDVVRLLHSFARDPQGESFPSLTDFLRALEAVDNRCIFELTFISTGELARWEDELNEQLWLRDHGIEPRG